MARDFRITLALAAAIAIAFWWAGSPAAHAASRAAPPPPTLDPLACRPFGLDPKKVNDHRLRDANDWMRFQFEDNWNSHTAPATERMAAGEYTRRVMADIDFTLRVWPNHVRGLQALIEYTVAGGKPYNFPPPECYFVNAKEFYDDDINVHMLEGLYYWRIKQYRRAKDAYRDALAIDPESVDAHYNFGLMCLELKEYDEALKHAHVAYRAGYPLAGLRKRLQAAGRWREPDPAAPESPST